MADVAEGGEIARRLYPLIQQQLSTTAPAPALKTKQSSGFV
jgi:hypothetical protein